MRASDIGEISGGKGNKKKKTGVAWSSDAGFQTNLPRREFARVKPSGFAGETVAYTRGSTSPMLPAVRVPVMVSN